MDVLEASAAEEIALAAVFADTPKTFMASAITTPAAATSIWPTVANSIAACPAPPSTCSTLMPALSSSRNEPAICVGPTPIACDICMDAALSRSSSWAVAPVDA